MTTGSYQVVATSSADSTAKGTATAFVTTPGSCATIPAAGAWEEITPPGVTDADAIVVDPFDPATVWLGTGKGSMTKGLFKSTDCGVTWTLVSTGQNSSHLDGDQWSMAIDPVDQGTIYTLSAYGSEGLWKSTNGGVDWTNLFPSGSDFATIAPYTFVNNISMDPNDHEHLLVMAHGMCNAPDTIGCEAESTNGGDTWNITPTPAPWGEGGGVQLLNATSWLWGSAEGENGTYLTTNNGQSWTQVLPGNMGAMNGEFSTHPVVRATDGAYYASALQGVIRSTDRTTWSLLPFDRIVGLAVGPHNLWGSDQWTPTFYSASLSDPSTWTTMSAPPSNLASDQGCPDLDYDATHTLLYASCLIPLSGAPGRVWRRLAP
jgi:hypothetical protein